MKHTIIIDSSLSGREYGSLRLFERNIISLTNANVIELKDIESDFQIKYLGHSMRLYKFRKLKKKKISISGDVLWYVIMGPENYKLDLFDINFKNFTYRIVYLFDTLQHQFSLIKRLFSNNNFNIKITAFNDAVISLKKITNCEWIHIEQAADDNFFLCRELDDRKIAFSSYGRRQNYFHEILKHFCQKNDLYYDYTMETNGTQLVDSFELYNQYAWHLTNSIFTISWPVAITNPQRSGTLNPITCRWFEAAVSGTIIIGKPPDNFLFESYFPTQLISLIDLEEDRELIFQKLEIIWENRVKLFELSKQLRSKNLENWLWSSRVNKILNYLNT